MGELREQRFVEPITDADAVQNVLMCVLSCGGTVRTPFRKLADVRTVTSAESGSQMKWIVVAISVLCFVGLSVVAILCVRLRIQKGNATTPEPRLGFVDPPPMPSPVRKLSSPRN